MMGALLLLQPRCYYSHLTDLALAVCAILAVILQEFLRIVMMAMSARTAHIQAKLDSLPNLPGVYQMLGKHGEILYVGKAKSLKNRVLSYFSKTIDHPKTLALVARIFDIHTIITRGETEALLLEQNLIKLHRPPYNVVLRDDKSYLYVYISKDKFPRLGFGRGKARHGEGLFFGPYPSAHGAKKTLDLVQKVFLLRKCTNHFFATRTRPCLEYQIKRCRAPCVGYVSAQEYAQDVEATVRFLKGDNSDIQASMVQKMHDAAENLQFEQAALYRDRLAMIQEVQARQAVYVKDGNADVMALEMVGALVCVCVLTVRGGQVLGSKNYFPDFYEEENALERFVLNFYSTISDDLPDEIIVSVPIGDALSAWFAQEFGKTPTIKNRVLTVRREWLQLAKVNAQNALKDHISTEKIQRRRFVRLQEVLSGVGAHSIDSIECFDISHTMGEAAIGSCVVFDAKGARKREYRQYAIKGITAGDDYAAMRQVLTRRYSKHALPDMLLIDGGKGQLNIAKEVLESLGKLDDTLLVGIAKGEGRKAGLEVLHFVYHAPMDLAPDDQALHFLMQIRDEAHRFAITKHRQKLAKARTGSILEAIHGLGKTRRRELLAHFGGMGQLLGASESEIAKVKGIGAKMARTIYAILHE